jgi:hypothetical protein
MLLNLWNDLPDHLVPPSLLRWLHVHYHHHFCPALRSIGNHICKDIFCQHIASTISSSLDPIPHLCAPGCCVGGNGTENEPSNELYGPRPLCALYIRPYAPLPFIPLSTWSPPSRTTFVSTYKLVSEATSQQSPAGLGTIGSERSLPAQPSQDPSGIPKNRTLLQCAIDAIDVWHCHSTAPTIDRLLTTVD